MTELARRYHAVILWLGEVTGQSDIVLHIHAGMAVFVLARLLTGRSFGTFVPFGFVLLAEVGNEVLDRLATGTWSNDTGMDLVNTLFWPLAISVGVRWRPMIIRDRRAMDGDERRTGPVPESLT